MYRTKLIGGETRALDGNRIEAVLSTEDVDRDGDIIRQRFWNLDNFMKHPVLLSSHDYYSLRSQIGEWEDVSVKGAKLIGVARYYAGEGNEEADWGHKLAVKGKAAYSVGFVPDMSKAREIPGDRETFFPSFEFRGQELLETSHVTVPSNPAALQHMKTARLHPVLAGIVADLLQEEGLAPTPDLLEELKAYFDMRFEEIKGLLVPKDVPLIVDDPLPDEPPTGEIISAADIETLGRELADAARRSL